MWPMILFICFIINAYCAVMKWNMLVDGVPDTEFTYNLGMFGWLCWWASWCLCACIDSATKKE